MNDEDRHECLVVASTVTGPTAYGLEHPSWNFLFGSLGFQTINRKTQMSKDVPQVYAQLILYVHPYRGFHKSCETF